MHAESIPTAVTGRLLEPPHVSQDADGAVAGFLLEVDERYKPRHAARPSRYRVVCAGRWTELVGGYLRQDSPVFVAGEAVANRCEHCADRKPHWLLADEVIPLGRFPNPDFQQLALSGDLAA